MTKAQIKAWLKQNKRTHSWLADQLFSSVHSVNGWLSSNKPIPTRRQAQIKALMQQHLASTGFLQTPSSPPDDRESTLSLTVPADVFDTWNEAAMHQGMLLREWAIDELNQWAETQAEEPGKE